MQDAASTDRPRNPYELQFMVIEGIPNLCTHFFSIIDQIEKNRPGPRWSISYKLYRQNPYVSDLLRLNSSSVERIFCEQIEHKSSVKLTNENPKGTGTFFWKKHFKVSRILLQKWFTRDMAGPHKKK